MVGDTVIVHCCCTLCGVCVTGGLAGVWPTTSTYAGRRCSPDCYPFGSLPRSARASRPGEQDALHSAVFERQDRLIPEREKGPPRNIRTSTPITPAGYGGGAIGPNGCGGELWDARQGEGPAGASERAPQQVVSERGAARETTKGLSRERWFRVKPRPRGAATRNGARIGRGSSCMEAANEAKDDPKPWKR